VLKFDQLPSIDTWLRSILWESHLPEADIDIPSDVQRGGKLFEIYRLKGSLSMDDGTIKFVQGVREIFEIKDAPRQSADALAKKGKLVLIGRNIERTRFRDSFSNAIERP
jgi:G3E family GTPase